MTKKIILSFSSDTTNQPIIYNLIKLYDIKINILKAEIQPEKKGYLLAEFETDENSLTKAIDYLNKNDVVVNSVSQGVFHDKSRCLECGNCASACFSNALTLSAPEWKLNFDAEKCIGCNLCLKSCPLKLFRIDFAEVS